MSDVIVSAVYTRSDHSTVLLTFDDGNKGFVDMASAGHNRTLLDAWLDAGHPVAAYGTPVPVPVPPVISDRQFFQQLAVIGAITNDEALNAVATGTIPTALLTYINALPSDQQFAAKMLISGATEFRRNHPLVAAFGSANGWTSDQIDDIWRAAAML